MISGQLKQSVILSLVFWFTASTWAAVPKSTQAFPEGDRLIYSRLVQAFRKNQLPELIRQRQLLERNYPVSVHLDNAIYLQGMLEFQNGQYGEAVRSFNLVTKKFTTSNKRPAALFAKGVTYERLNLKPLAIQSWKAVIKDYPGSPESQRAWMHLRMEKISVKK